MTEKGLDFEAINYLENPVSAKELKELLQRAGLKPVEAVRTNEAAYREHFANRKLTDDQLIEVMVKHPELIQRPIVVRGKQAVLARSPEKLVELGIK